MLIVPSTTDATMTSREELRVWELCDRTGGARRNAHTVAAADRDRVLPTARFGSSRASEGGGVSFLVRSS